MPEALALGVPPPALAHSKAASFPANPPPAAAPAGVRARGRGTPHGAADDDDDDDDDDDPPAGLDAAVTLSALVLSSPEAGKGASWLLAIAKHGVEVRGEIPSHGEALWTAGDPSFLACPMAESSDADGVTILSMAEASAGLTSQAAAYRGVILLQTTAGRPVSAASGLGLGEHAIKLRPNVAAVTELDPATAADCPAWRRLSTGVMQACEKSVRGVLGIDAPASDTARGPSASWLDDGAPNARLVDTWVQHAWAEDKPLCGVAPSVDRALRDLQVAGWRSAAARVVQAVTHVTTLLSDDATAKQLTVAASSLLWGVLMWSPGADALPLAGFVEISTTAAMPWSVADIEAGAKANAGVYVATIGRAIGATEAPSSGSPPPGPPTAPSSSTSMPSTVSNATRFLVQRTSDNTRAAGFYVGESATAESRFMERARGGGRAGGTWPAVSQRKGKTWAGANVLTKMLVATPAGPSTKTSAAVEARCIARRRLVESATIVAFETAGKLPTSNHPDGLVRVQKGATPSQLLRVRNLATTQVKASMPARARGKPAEAALKTWRAMVGLVCAVRDEVAVPADARAVCLQRLDMPAWMLDGAASRKRGGAVCAGLRRFAAENVDNLPGAKDLAAILAAGIARTAGREASRKSSGRGEGAVVASATGCFQLKRAAKNGLQHNLCNFRASVVRGRGATESRAAINQLMSGLDAASLGAPTTGLAGPAAPGPPPGLDAGQEYPCAHSVLIEMANAARGRVGSVSPLRLIPTGSRRCSDGGRMLTLSAAPVQMAPSGPGVPMVGASGRGFGTSATSGGEATDIRLPWAVFSEEDAGTGQKASRFAVRLGGDGSAGLPRGSHPGVASQAELARLLANAARARRMVVPAPDGVAGTAPALVTVWVGDRALAPGPEAGPVLELREGAVGVPAGAASAAMLAACGWEAARGCRILPPGFDSGPAAPVGRPSAARRPPEVRAALQVRGIGCAVGRLRAHPRRRAHGSRRSTEGPSGAV